MNPHVLTSMKVSQSTDYIATCTVDALDKFVVNTQEQFQTIAGERFVSSVASIKHLMLPFHIAVSTVHTYSYWEILNYNWVRGHILIKSISVINQNQESINTSPP